MQNGKYVPPALRSEAQEFAPGQPTPMMAPYGGGTVQYVQAAMPQPMYQPQMNARWADNGGGGGGGGSGYGQQGGGGYGGAGGGRSYGSYGQQGGSSYSGGGGGYGGSGGYQQGGYSGRSNYGNSGGGGGYGGGGGGRSFGGGGGGGGGRSYAGNSGFESSFSSANALGFHGDERPNPRIERELFHSGEGQTTGINFDKYDDIPVEVSEGCPEAMLEFSTEVIGEQLFRNLTMSKFTRPTPVQKYSIPIGVAGGDMMACAQTGSGKTGGFLFPVIAGLTRVGARPPPDNGRRSCYISALILAPTRELASQIFDEAQKFCYCTGIRPVVVYGGANMQTQTRELDRGADLLVATPGRLVDLIERGRVKLDCVQFLILDEADRMLDMGFEPQIRQIVQENGMPRDRQTFMFSATFPLEIQRLASDFMKNYIFVTVGRVGAASKDVTQTVVWKEQEEKYPYVQEFLGSLPTGGLVLIFVETKRGADYLEEMLYNRGFATSSIHGDKSQREREEALKMFKTGRTPFLVATDVAARGLDIPNVTQVINFDMPSNIDDYVHRIGRTGRVGNIGNALSLFNDKNRNIGKELAELLIENDQVCPEWLERFHGGFGGSGGGRGGRGRGRGGSKFGARDFRKETGGGRGPGGPSSGGRGTSSYSAPTGGSFAPQAANVGAYRPATTGPSDNSAW